MRIKFRRLLNAFFKTPGHQASIPAMRSRMMVWTEEPSGRVVIASRKMINMKIHQTVVMKFSAMFSFSYSIYR